MYLYIYIYIYTYIFDLSLSLSLDPSPCNCQYACSVYWDDIMCMCVCVWRARHLIRGTNPQSPAIRHETVDMEPAT